MSGLITETPTVRVACGKCERIDEYDLLKLAGRDDWSTRNVQKRAERDRWKFTGDGPVCEECRDDI